MENLEMKRVLTVQEKKYVLIDTYKGFGIYQEKCATGYFISQSYLLVNSNYVTKLVIGSFNNIIEEELYDMIDEYNLNGKFNVKAFKKVDSYNSKENLKDDILVMHPGADILY